MIKQLARRMLPYQLIDGGRRVLHFGLGVTCPICGARLRRYKKTGYGYPMLDRLQVVGGLARYDDSCWVCHGSSRDRLIKLYVERFVPRPRGRPLRVLHMAPEKGLSAWLSRAEGVAYTAADINPTRYYHLDDVQRMDLTALPVEDGSVDLMLCCHILEHVPDDGAAMREIRRVLADGGVALLQTPIALRASATDEDFGPLDDAERIRRFGQKDHVRLYTDPDYVARLEAAGLAVERWNAFDADENEASRQRLDPFETLYVCRRGDAAAAPA
jgi:SAM-dependent methyltransferase